MTTDEEIDGESAIRLAQRGTTEDMKQCGLNKLRSSLKFKELFSFDSPAIQTVHFSPVQGKKLPAQDRKLLKTEIEMLTEEERKIYYIKYVIALDLE